MEQQKKLTPRQWDLYNFLKENYSSDEFISKKVIANHLGYDWKDDSERNGRDIEKDIRALKDSDVIQKIIISSNKGYKIANNKEVLKHLKRERIRILRSLKLNYKSIEKAQLDGQMRIAFGKERDYIEAFIFTKEKGSSPQGTLQDNSTPKEL